MDAFAAASAKHQPKSYIPSTLKTQNILILLLLFWADWSVRAVLKISANLTFAGILDAVGSSGILKGKQKLGVT